MVKILIPLFTKVEEIESLTIIDLLRRAGANVVTASIEAKKQVKGGQGVLIEADQLLKDVLSDKTFDGIVLPGGPGTSAMGNCEPLLNLIKEHAATHGHLVAAICAAPTILGKAGVLANKKATCYPGMEGGLNAKQFVAEKVVIDGDIITSRGPGTAFEFSLTLIERLFGKEKRAQIAQGTVYL
ncbi:MAG: putative Chaperone protein YajL [Streblomastix strix]|uniref:Putative Chaperone protein YajL n=1 Tax=Streblomastix strix TaxID=222440 RepID=A0A5J4W3I4_9EUKA|nr:MAG: putative Chaperone protein YajL [Streblomastix strix]